VPGGAVTAGVRRASLRRAARDARDRHLRSKAPRNARRVVPQSPVVCRSTPYASPSGQPVGFSNGYSTGFAQPPPPPQQQPPPQQPQNGHALKRQRAEAGRLSLEDRLDLTDLCHRRARAA
jgi:hypothetical protein